jgi:hypothetical protein
MIYQRRLNLAQKAHKFRFDACTKREEKHRRKRGDSDPLGFDLRCIDEETDGVGVFRDEVVETEHAQLED